ncbi:MAG: biotin--[acetyl-CoA-carboxylase] ligase [candidate division Zixibacteria bacterium]|nr:biotin--[acetyl-CoA-carboxylase] ligase [candidate division Zixibacteria bacterium]
MKKFRDIVRSGEKLQDIADHLLAYIRDRKTVARERLQRRFKLDADELAAALREIGNWGYRLKLSAKDVTFVDAPDLLTATEVGYQLKTRLIGRHIHSYRLVKSTNDLVSQMAESGAPEGSIVTAEQQSQGRGRLGRTWFSPESTGIYVSILLRPHIKPEQAPGLSIMTSLALADTLDPVAPGEVQIKWPNDILIGGKKVCGVLTELSAERHRILHVVVGVGINVNQRAADFPADIKRTATSLRVVTKKKLNRAELLKSFLRNFEREYLDYQKYGLKKSQRRLRKYSSMLGKSVRILSGENVIEGVAVDIDTSGALILYHGGKRIPISAGEVSILKQ